ncbi:UNVERIFIED_CONTAM: hypothetical protein PYX00_003642 [Menopon gallinae]|uniref:Helix-turn-helix domain-containing protein n=1 Tax=Menopon gallinae TaxID=328185 RepID=A0AAW2I2C2_9NEOP
MENLEKQALESATQKPTHWFRYMYLHAASNHHPAQKSSVIKTLIHRAIQISAPDALPQEIEHLDTALRTNGYTKINITHTAKTLTNEEKQNTQPREKERLPLRVFLPYIQGVTDRIGRHLRKHGIHTIFTPTTKIGQILRTPKDPTPPLEKPGIYNIPCICGKVYIGMGQRNIQTRIKEHERHIRLNQPDKSAIAEHSLSEQHRILFNRTRLIAQTICPSHLQIRESIEIHKHPYNINRDTGFRLSKTWTPVLPRPRANGTQPTDPTPTPHPRDIPPFN